MFGRCVHLVLLATGEVADTLASRALGIVREISVALTVRFIGTVGEVAVMLIRCAIGAMRKVFDVLPRHLG